MRALLGTASHFCVSQKKTIPNPASKIQNAKHHNRHSRFTITSTKITTKTPHCYPIILYIKSLPETYILFDSAAGMCGHSKKSPFCDGSHKKLTERKVA